MKNAIKLFFMDLKKIAKTPGVLVILGGLALLPSFYAWFNLEATWDPYGNTKNIKVAVVNEDKGDTVKDKKVNVGNQITDTLKKDDNFDWQFVSRKKADHDLKMGEYYAAIYIPDKFTHQITGTLRKDPQQADVEYKVNQKLNAIAPKMTDAGTSAIVQKANEQFNETVTQALLDEANRLGVKLEEEIPTINKIEDAVSKANEAMPKINDFADTLIYLDENQDQIDDYANRFRELDNYKGEVIDAADKLNQVNAAIPALNERAKLILALNDYMPNIENALNVASNDVPEAFPKINRGVDIASAGVDAGLQGLNDAQGYLPAIQQRVESYQEVVDNAQDANQNVNNRLQNNMQTEQQSTTVSDRYSNIKTSQISNNQSDNNENDQNETTVSSKDVSAMTSSLSESLLSLSNYTDKQAESSQEDIEALKNVTYGILSTDKPKDFQKTLDHIKSRLEVTSKSNQQFIDILSELEERENVDLSDEIQTLESANNRINNLIKNQNQLSDALSNGSSGKAEAVELLKDLPRVNSSLDDLRHYIKTELNQRLLNISNDIMSVLNEGDTRLSTVQSKLNTIDQVINSGESILTAGKDRIETIQSALPVIEQSYMDAMEIAQNAYPQFEQSVANAASFIENDLPGLEQQLSDTTATVNNTIPTLFNRYDQLVDILDANQPRAKEGLHNLADFARNQLPDVEKDLAKANDLFDEIEDDDAVDKMVDLLKNDLKKQANVIANPIDIDQKDIFPVKDYGSASTPFYTALAIWVGALLMVSLLTTDNKHQSLAPYLSTRAIYLGKSGLFYLLGIIQALIVSIGDIVILKAQVESIGWFIGISVFSSIVFVSIVYTLVSLLGNPGKAIAIIFLVLQIAGGGGTFPIQVTPEFFQAIHPYLPFSYAIDALREAVGGPVPKILTEKLTVLSLFGIGFLLIGVIFKPITDPLMRKATEKAEKSDVME
ncbi:YhgE/Pip domain-containing protein [Staphylococcus nepalensis]|uniref:YhgE/Pip domain-containing protein n=1 Tax=Staphylococcus nepalensis TaxID=214473 RepID=UPI000E033A70|nr:YhgE/Pip domain-containing protein [Staphylococcus nepalensis]MBO1222356.1 YhgE/Pip domain-containing protein [Staphylococcus nepalensis]SUM66455.1 phage infection protein [Staphylococcus nepalensis]SUM94392.1 phage infection protein [Staphylococcus nepalensis]